jgi:hypothetical protein
MQYGVYSKTLLLLFCSFIPRCALLRIPIFFLQFKIL